MDNTRYTMRELADAVGMTVGKINYRAKVMGIRCGQKGITYEDAKEIMRFKPKMSPKYNKTKVEKLRQQLKTDGFNVK